MIRAATILVVCLATSAFGAIQSINRDLAPRRMAVSFSSLLETTGRRRRTERLGSVYTGISALCIVRSPWSTPVLELTQWRGDAFHEVIERGHECVADGRKHLLVSEAFSERGTVSALNPERAIDGGVV